MLFYAQKLSGRAEHAGLAEPEDVAEGDATEQEEAEGDAVLSNITDQIKHPLAEPEEEGDEDSE